MSFPAYRLSDAVMRSNTAHLTVAFILRNELCTRELSAEWLQDPLCRYMAFTTGENFQANMWPSMSGLLMGKDDSIPQCNFWCQPQIPTHQAVFPVNRPLVPRLYSHLAHSLHGRVSLLSLSHTTSLFQGCVRNCLLLSIWPLSAMPSHPAPTSPWRPSLKDANSLSDFFHSAQCIPCGWITTLTMNLP